MSRSTISTRLWLIAVSLFLAGCVTSPLRVPRASAPYVFRITASQGDGSQCTATKYADSDVNLYFGCVSPDRLLSGGQHLYRVGAVNSMNPGAQLIVFNDIACLFGVNPTGAGVSMGSLSVVPAMGVAYSCSTNARTSGQVTGQSTPIQGTVTWP